MIEQKYLRKLKEIICFKNSEIDVTKTLLCAVALKEKSAYNFYKSRKTAQAFSGLRRYKFIRHIKNGRDEMYSLTPKGESRLHDIIIDNIKITNQKSWDGKWHLVMYDLPVRFKKARNAFRWKLKDLGFFQFQKSAWIYPYSCEEEVLFVADFYGVRKHIEILEVDKILDDRKLRAHFRV